MFLNLCLFLIVLIIILHYFLFNTKAKPKILIVSLFYNSSIHVNRFFSLIYNLTYPKSQISLGLLEGDSTDNTSLLIESNISKVKKLYHSIKFIHKNVSTKIPNNNDRYSLEIQRVRRSNLALLRNTVINSTLKNEEYILSIDSDVSLYSNNILNILLKANKDVVVPICRHEKNNDVYDINVWVFTPDANEYIKKQNNDYLLQQPYRFHPVKYLKHIGILHEENKKYGLMYSVRVDGIGGTMALIKSKVIQNGVVFPEKLYKHCLETEGFGLMANDYNFSVAALPNLSIYHYD